MNHQQLRKKVREELVERFSVDDLHELCLSLDIDYDDLPGDGKGAKVRELITLCERECLAARLVQEARQMRPLPAWDWLGPDNPDLYSKLDHLRQLAQRGAPPGCPFALVGSVYLDILLRPIHTMMLGAKEWSDIQPLAFTLGGSCLWVGRYLNRLCGQKSYLFSMQGRGNNVCTEEFESLLAEEGDWLRNEIVLGAENTCTAVTVHLVQHDNSFTSMFTHRGVLAGFHCNQIPRVHEILRDGGVMYVSGIFKTYLWNDLALNLRRLKRLPGKTLVCVDHGRLIVKEEASESKEPEVDSAAVKAVCNVFKQDLVDVYFCTYGELLDFYRIAEDFYPENRQNVEQTLAELASRHKLPFITIVRYRDDQGEARAYAIVGGQTNSQEGEPVQYVLQDCIGPINAFNAVFMHRLIRGCNEFSLLELVDAAVRAGLEGWQRAARHSHAVVHN